MRAVLMKRAGSIDGLTLVEVPEPTVGPADVLVQIRAASVTRGDVVLRKLPRLVTRLVGETPKSILGHEFAGDVEAVGEDVASFAVGDRVFGTTTGLRQGSHAEYIAVPEAGVLATIPSNVSYEEAATVPVGAMTALYFLREGNVSNGKRVLVNGASGSVGTFAVQIAKHLGAHVTGVASSTNLELVESLGADEVVDYTRRDFTRGDQTYDVIFDAAAKSSAKRARSVLTDDGAFVTTQTRRDETTEDLLTIRDLLDTGVLKPVIEASYRLDQVPDAHRHVEQGHKRGNVAVIV